MVLTFGLWVFGFVLAGLNGDPQSVLLGVGPVAPVVVGPLIVCSGPKTL